MYKLSSICTNYYKYKNIPKICKFSIMSMSIDNIIYEDNHIIILTKPTDFLCQGDITNDIHLVSWLKSYLANKYNKQGNVYIGLIHRLDRPSSGLLVIAKTSKAAIRLHKDLYDHKFEKRYLCIVEGKLVGNGLYHHFLTADNNTSKVKVLNIHNYNHNNTLIKNNNIKYVEAKLTYKSLFNFITKQNHIASLIEIILLTGRKHQIRSQFSYMGYPIYGDIKYGSSTLITSNHNLNINKMIDKSNNINSNNNSGIKHTSHIALHSYKLSLYHPISKNLVSFTSMVPDIWNSFCNDETIFKIKDFIVNENNSQIE